MENEPVATVHFSSIGRVASGVRPARSVEKIIHNYEHRDLVAGLLWISGYGVYLHLQKDNEDVFVEVSDLENKQSLSDIINRMINEEPVALEWYNRQRH